MEKYVGTIMEVLNFRLRKLNLIILAIEDTEGFLNRGVTQPSLRFWRKILIKEYWTLKAQRKGIIKGFIQGNEGMS